MADLVYKKTCTACGLDFETAQRKKRLCPDCTEGRIKERVKKARQNYKKPEALKKKAKETSQAVESKTVNKWDARRCKKCFYGAILDGNYQICDYISITGHSRPCDPGADCTEFKPKVKGYKRPKMPITIPRMEKTGEFGSYLQDSIFRTEKKRRSRF